ncbi:hypothetical protein C8Q80DRAFT_678538 [Daedaleopsis nitida]|nr:hypothetical protein C8Q80DRAFT_678538 [Daedaleopsis nitida]
MSTPLKLDLAQRVGLERQAIWSSSETRFPWPHLATLSISYPHPENKIYGLLPSSLCHLALRCWPRHYILTLEGNRALMKKLGWYSPVLTSSGMLHIIRRIRYSPSASHISELDLEVQDDERCQKLYREIPLVFPNLTFLQIYRYRIAGLDELAIVSPQVASLHCDANRTAVDRHVQGLGIAVLPTCSTHSFAVGGENHQPVFRIATADLPDVFACNLSPSVLWVCILDRTQGAVNEWLPFRVVRGADPHAVLDADACDSEGYS